MMIARDAIVLGVSVLAVTFVGGCTSTGRINSEQAIASRHDGYIRAMNANDFAAAAGFLSDDLVRKPPHEPAHRGRDAFQAWMAEINQIISYRLTRDALIVRDDLGYIRGVYDITLHLRGIGEISDTGQYIEVWRRERDGQWYMTEGIWNTSLPR
jgi:ketosteroid isomerase-like protein